MAKKFSLDKKGVRDLLRSPEMMDICEEYANRAMASLGDGYEVTSMVGKNRVNVEISAATFQARRENSKNNTILKALGGSKSD